MKRPGEGVHDPAELVEPLALLLGQRLARLAEAAQRRFGDHRADDPGVAEEVAEHRDRLHRQPCRHLTGQPDLVEILRRGDREQMREPHRLAPAFRGGVGFIEVHRGLASSSDANVGVK